MKTKPQTLIERRAYEARRDDLETQGMSTSDAQAVIEAQDMDAERNGITIAPERDDAGKIVFHWSAKDMGAYSDKWEGAFNDALICTGAKPLASRADANDWEPVGVTLKALASVKANAGALLGATYEINPCGCRIVGNGTLRHLLAIEFCPLHQAAGDLLDFVRAMSRCECQAKHVGNRPGAKCACFSCLASVLVKRADLKP